MNFLLLSVALVLLFDVTATVYSAKTLSRIRSSSKEKVNLSTVLFQPLFLLAVRVGEAVGQQVDKKNLAAYKRNQPLLSQVLFAEFIILAVLVGLSFAVHDISIKSDDYISGRENDSIVLMILLSGFAALSAGAFYSNTKSFVERFRSRLLLNFDSIEYANNVGVSSDALLQGAQASPEKGSPMGKQVVGPVPLYRSLEFFDETIAKRAIDIYRTERHGQYQYFGVPEPRTLVVHRQDVSGLVERLERDGIYFGQDFEIKPVLLAGQLPFAERVEARRRGIAPSSLLTNRAELTRRAEEAEERLEQLKKMGR